MSLERVAVRFTAWAERTIPDAFVFALAATFLVVAAAFGFTKASAFEIVDLWGKGFWDLLPFTLQMALVVITGYVVASTAPVHALIVRLANVPKNGRQAATMVALIAMLTSWLNWGFSLMFSAMLARETARRVPRADYRTLAACSFLGLGSIWAQGLSGSAALQMASSTSMQAATRDIVGHGTLVPGGIISLAHTIFLWQSLVSVAVEIAVVTLVVYLAAPSAENSKTASDLGIEIPEHENQEREARATTWSARAENSPIFSGLFVILASVYLARYFMKSASVVTAFNLDTLNLIFLTLGVALHKTPARLMVAVKDATPAVWGILLQFPFYAGIAAIVSKTELNHMIASAFVHISNAATFPALIALYSTVLGIFVPSGGSKWVIEAPYVMQAAHDLKVHLGWMVAVYDLGEALANLVQPFWMLPILGLFQLRARDVMGFTFLIFLALTPVVLVLVTLLGLTLHYPL